MDQLNTTRINQSVGQRLRMRRTALKLSQTDLSHALGVSYQQIQKYERGANGIPVGRLYQLAHALDVPVSYFFYDLEQKWHVAGNDSSPTEFATLMDNFQRIQSRRTRKYLADLTRAMVHS